MSVKAKSTAPKPFVFVLMPFSDEFDHIYESGIKSAADELGAYAERVDEQNFRESILDRVYNQINKADVIVADMTGRNPNVFYEVGYAHALGRLVILLAQKDDDITFDLKHQQCVVYGGDVERLRSRLKAKLRWAIAESRQPGQHSSRSALEVSLAGTLLQESRKIKTAPEVVVEKRDGSDLVIPATIRNTSTEALPISDIYLFASPTSKLRPDDVFSAAAEDAEDGLSAQHPVEHNLSTIGPRATGRFEVSYGVYFQRNHYEMEDFLRLRIHTARGFHDFPFRLKAERVKR